MRSGMKKRTSKSSKRKGRHPPQREPLYHYSVTSLHWQLRFAVHTSRLTIRGGEPACQTNVPVAKFRCDEVSRHVLYNKLSCAVGCFRGEPCSAPGKIS